MKFIKYHGLGNDYIVINPSELGRELRVEEIRKICNRNFGVGSDGVLFGPVEVDPKDAEFGVRIFNPDGSEAEKSGNGLRIFSRYLWDSGLSKKSILRIWTKGGIVNVAISKEGRWIEIDMGKVSFDSELIPVVGPHREVINETINIGGHLYTYCAATIGNPHCVIVGENVNEELARKIGPIIETHSNFPNRTNVQFLEVIDRKHIHIEIWERGAGYTLASGSSSCAAAAVAHRLGLCDSDVIVKMPGGDLQIHINTDFTIRMAGPVTRVCQGTVDNEIFIEK